MHSVQPLQLAYAANLIILLPIAVPTLLGLWDTAQHRFDESAGWRVLVGALWTAILVGSALGLRAPLQYAPLLLLQVIYKTLWLAVYAAPRLVRGQASRIPSGIALCFVAIVVVYPLVLPWHELLRAER
mgnify:CR=1 FL=1